MAANMDIQVRNPLLLFVLEAEQRFDFYRRLRNGSNENLRDKNCMQILQTGSDLDVQHIQHDAACKPASQ